MISVRNGARPADRPYSRYATWRTGSSRHAGALLFVAVLGVVLAMILALLPAYSGDRDVVVLPLTLAMLAVTLQRREASIPVIFVFLIFLGEFRRILDAADGQYPSFDSLLVISPLLVVVLFLYAMRRGAMRDRTTLTNAFLILNILAAVEVINPLQGSIKSGISGLFYNTLPILWFWIGRALVDERLLSRVLNVFYFLSIPLGIYGLLQFGGVLLPWDSSWAKYIQSALKSLFVGGVLRSFGTFTSGQEYGTFLAVAIAILMARLLTRRTKASPIALALLAMFGVGLFLCSLREAFFLMVAGVAAMVAAKRRVGLTRMGLYGLVALAGLVVAAGALGGGGGGGGGSAALANHEVAGLSDPFGSQQTGTGHIVLIIKAIEQLHKNPIGYGTGAGHHGPSGSTHSNTGALTVAKTSKATRAPRSFIGGADADPGDVAIWWGVVGLGAYLVIAFQAIKRALILAGERQDWVPFAVLGILVACFLRWFEAFYALVPLVWVCIGWLDREAPTHATVAVRRSVRASRRPAADADAVTPA